ncbi:MAG: adenylate kinase [Armatimonadetes bacterium]|nr:adenylate kinase [Armatimonadota bacterium]
MPAALPRRLSIVGNTGSGKSALARRVAAILEVPHIELDALNWLPGWTMRDSFEFMDLVEEQVDLPGWVMDGNYRRVQPMVWTAADTVVWLDYSYPLILARLLRRTAARYWRRELLWGTNRESLRELLSRDSLFLWQIRRHRAMRADLEQKLITYPLPHLRVVRLRTPRATERWVAELARAAAEGSAGTARNGG